MKTALKRTLSGLLVAANTLLSACWYKDNDSLNSFTPVVQEEYSPQEQKKADNLNTWYNEASQDNIISSEELNDLEARIEYKQNDSGKRKAVSLAQLASETLNPDVNKDGRTNIFDLLELLKILKHKDSYPTLAGDVDNNGKTDIFDLLTLLQVINGIYNTTLINGRLLDTDTWQPNLDLNGWVECLGDTVWADNNGRYSKRIKKQDLVSLTAGYKDKSGNPASFVRTVNNVDGRTNQTIDIAICTYLNLGDVSPEGFREGLRESNFEANSWYSGAKALRKDMVWYLIKKGRILDINDQWAREFTDDQWIELQEIINEVNTNLKHPLPIVTDTTGWYPKTDNEKKGKILIQRRLDAGIGSIGHSDFDNDGRKDYTSIYLLDPVLFPNGGYEEANTSLTAVSFTKTPILAVYNDPDIKGKMMIYEGSGLQKPSIADIKNQRFWETITYEVGQLYPKMSIDDVLKLQ